MFISDKKKFATELKEIIEMIESGRAVFCCIQGTNLHVTEKKKSKEFGFDVYPAMQYTIIIRGVEPVS